MKVAVIGAGSWGTTVAAMLAPKCETTLWARRVELAEHINGGTNPDYLPGFELPPELAATTNVERAIDGADVLVMGVPSHGYRSVLEQAAPLLAPEMPILSLTKGIEQPTLMRMTEVTSDVLRDHDRSHIGALTGPNLAKEILAGAAAASVIAMTDNEIAETFALSGADGFPMPNIPEMGSVWGPLGEQILGLRNLQIDAATAMANAAEQVAAAVEG